MGRSPRSLNFQFFAIAAADLNGDGKLDLVGEYVANNNAQTTYVVVAFGNGDGTFTSSQVFPVPAIQSTTIRLLDFNGDGILDIALDAADYSVFLAGKGDGTFAQPSELFLLGASTYQGSGDFGDFLGTGKPDAISADGQSEIWIVRNTSK